jgi:hypothetical protein
MKKVPFASFCESYNLDVGRTAQSLNLVETVQMIFLRNDGEKEIWKVAGTCLDSITMRKDQQGCWRAFRGINDLMPGI